MKSNKILGIPITLLVIGILCISGASALIVEYLSNEASAKVTVTSPINVEFATVKYNIDNPVETMKILKEHDKWSDTLEVGSIIGYDTLSLGLKINNKVDVNIEGKHLIFKITNDKNDVTCKDFSKSLFIDAAYFANDGSAPIQDLNNDNKCKEDNGMIMYDILLKDIPSNADYRYPLSLTFDNVNPSEYKFTAIIK